MREPFTSRRSLPIVGRLQPRHPHQIAIFRQRDVVRRHHVVPGLDPPPPVALGTQAALGALADQIVFVIPLAVPGADRTHDIEIARPRLDRDAVEGMGVLRGGAGDDAGFMGQVREAGSSRSRFGRHSVSLGF